MLGLQRNGGIPAPEDRVVPKKTISPTGLADKPAYGVARRFRPSRVGGSIPSATPGAGSSFSRAFVPGGRSPTAARGPAPLFLRGPPLTTGGRFARLTTVSTGVGGRPSCSRAGKQGIPVRFRNGPAAVTERKQSRPVFVAIVARGILAKRREGRVTRARKSEDLPTRDKRHAARDSRRPTQGS